MIKLRRYENPPLSFFGPVGSSKGETAKKKKKKKKKKRTEKAGRIGNPPPSQTSGGSGAATSVVAPPPPSTIPEDRSDDEIRQEVNTLLRGFFLNTDEERFLSDVNMFLKTVCGNVGVPLSEAWAGGVSGGLEGLVALALDQMRIRGVFALFGRKSFDPNNLRFQPRAVVNPPNNNNNNNNNSARKNSRIESAYRQPQQRIGLLFDGNTYETYWKTKYKTDGGEDDPATFLFQFITNVSNSLYSSNEPIPQWIDTAKEYIRSGGSGNEDHNTYLSRANYYFDVEDTLEVLVDASNSITFKIKMYQIMSAIVLHVIWGLAQIQRTKEFDELWPPMVDGFQSYSVLSDKNRTVDYSDAFREIYEKASGFLKTLVKTVKYDGLNVSPQRQTDKSRGSTSNQTFASSSSASSALADDDTFTKGSTGAPADDDTPTEGSTGVPSERNDETDRKRKRSDEEGSLSVKKTTTSDEQGDSAVVLFSQLKKLHELDQQRQAQLEELERLEAKRQESTTKEQQDEIVKLKEEIDQKNAEIESTELTLLENTKSNAEEILRLTKNLKDAQTRQSEATAALKQQQANAKEEIAELKRKMDVETKQQLEQNADDVRNKYQIELAKIEVSRDEAVEKLENEVEQQKQKAIELATQLKNAKDASNIAEQWKLGEIERLKNRLSDTQNELEQVKAQQTKQESAQIRALRKKLRGAEANVTTSKNNAAKAEENFQTEQRKNQALAQQIASLQKQLQDGQNLSRLATALENTTKELANSTQLIAEREKDRQVTNEAVRKAQEEFNDIQLSYAAELGKFQRLDAEIASLEERKGRLEKTIRNVASLGAFDARLRVIEGRPDTLDWLVTQINTAGDDKKVELVGAFANLLKDEVFKMVMDHTLNGVEDDGGGPSTLRDTLEYLKTQLDTLNKPKPSEASGASSSTTPPPQSQEIEELRKIVGSALTATLNNIRREFDNTYAKKTELPNQMFLEENVRRMVDKYLDTKKEEINKASRGDNNDDTASSSVATFGKPDDIRVFQEDQDHAEHAKELADARAKLALATRTLEVANDKLAKQAQETKDDAEKIAQLQRATDNIEKQAAALDVRKRDIDLREAMMEMQRERQLDLRLRGGARGGRSYPGSRGGGGGGGGGPPGGDSGDVEYERERERERSLRERAAEIDLQRKMVDLQAARRRAEEIGAPSSSSAAAAADLEETRAFRRREHELRIQTMEAALREKLLGSQRGNGGASSSSSSMRDDQDPEERAYRRREHELRLRQMEADLQGKLLDNQKRGDGPPGGGPPGGGPPGSGPPGSGPPGSGPPGGGPPGGGSSSSGMDDDPDPEERAFRQRERDLKLRKMEAELQERMLSLSTKRAEAELEKNAMKDDPAADPQKAADERAKRQVELEKAKAQLQETLAKLANEKRKADREDRRDSAIDDVLHYEQVKRGLELRKLKAQVDAFGAELTPNDLERIQVFERVKRETGLDKLKADWRKSESETSDATLAQLRQYEKEKRDAERRKLNSETSRPNLRAIRKHEQKKREYEDNDWDLKLDKAQEDLEKARQDLARAKARDASGYDLRKLKLEVDRAQAQVVKQMADNQQSLSLAPIERRKRELENELADLRVQKQRIELNDSANDRQLQQDKLDAAKKKYEADERIQQQKIEVETLKAEAAKEKANADRALQREKLDYDRNKYREELAFNKDKRRLELEQMEQKNKRQRLDYDIAARKFRRDEVLPRRDILQVYEMLKSNNGADVAQVRAMLSFIGINDLKNDRVLFEHFISEPFVAAIQHGLNSVSGGRKPLTFVGILQRGRLVQPFAMVTADAYRFNLVNNSGSASVLAIQQSARKLGVSISKFKGLTGASTAQRGSYQRGVLRDMLN